MKHCSACGFRIAFVKGRLIHRDLAYNTAISERDVKSHIPKECNCGLV